MDSPKRLTYNTSMTILLVVVVVLSGTCIFTALHLDRQTLGSLNSRESVLLWGLVVILLGVLLTVAMLVRGLNRNLRQLRRFVKDADEGREMDELPSFTDDELGEISKHIVNLYLQIRRTTEDLQHEHAMALHQEQEKIRIKRQLTNNINHELKTPVSSIRGYLETILANPDMDEATRTEFMQKSYAQCERLRVLLRDVATITRMDEASTMFTREEVDLRRIVDDIAADIALLPADRRMRVNISMPESLPVVGNATLLTSVFRNLADNSIAYSGGRDIYILLTSETPTHYNFRVADNGIGVDERHLAHLFERFYRVDKGRSRKEGGTGLGLAIVKNAVLFHGGTIEVRNRHEGGLEFLFSIARSQKEK